MKNIDLSRTISILANIGVIAGIVFLGIELRQNNQLLRNEARYNFMDNAATGSWRRAENGELMLIRVKAINKEPLTQDEELRLIADSSVIFVNWAWEYEQYQLGFLRPPLPVDAYRSLIQGYPYLAEHFEIVKSNYESDFVQFMEETILNR